MIDETKAAARRKLLRPMTDAEATGLRLVTKAEIEAAIKRCEVPRYGLRLTRGT